MTKSGARPSRAYTNGKICMNVRVCEPKSISICTFNAYASHSIFYVKSWAWARAQKAVIWHRFRGDITSLSLSFFVHSISFFFRTRSSRITRNNKLREKKPTQMSRFGLNFYTHTQWLCACSASAYPAKAPAINFPISTFPFDWILYFMIIPILNINRMRTFLPSRPLSLSVVCTHTRRGWPHKRSHAIHTQYWWMKLMRRFGVSGKRQQLRNEWICLQRRAHCQQRICIQSIKCTEIKVHSASKCYWWPFRTVHKIYLKSLWKKNNWNIMRA